MVKLKGKREGKGDTDDGFVLRALGMCGVCERLDSGIAECGERVIRLIGCSISPPPSRDTYITMSRAGIERGKED